MKRKLKMAPYQNNQDLYNAYGPSKIPAVRLILSKIQGFEDVFNNKKQVVFDTTEVIKDIRI